MLHEQLVSFADAIRNPANAGKEDADVQRRMSIYRSLFFNNVNGFLQNGFPVLYSLYSASDWENLVRRFFIEHACSSPYFIDISKEFVEYLSNGYTLTDSDPVFMKELAHYEWLELALSVRKTNTPVSYCTSQQIPEQIVASPLSELVSYPYPVHQISVDFQPQESTGVHYYLLYRNPQQHVRFQHLAPLSAMTFNLLAQQALSIEQVTDSLSEQVGDMNQANLIEGLQSLIQQWLECGAIVSATDNHL